MDALLLRRRMMMAAGEPEEYIVFADPEVERICAETWGDGVGITPSQAARVTSIGTTFQSNTLIETFDEFEEYFVNVKSLVTNAFSSCTGLKRFIVPARMTSLANALFNGCTGLEYLDIKTTLTLTANQLNGTNYNVGKTGAYLHVAGDWNATGSNANNSNKRFHTIVIDGDLSYKNSSYYFMPYNYTHVLKIGGDISSTRTLVNTSSVLEFFEVMGSGSGITSSDGLLRSHASGSSCIVHFGKDGICMSPTQLGDLSGVSKIYVGPGESQAGDQAILAQYLADTDWAAYSDKLDTWWNYSGDFKD